MTQKKEVLILDAGFSAVPFIEIAKEQGFFVTVCSGKEHDPGHQFADRSIIENYASRETVLDIAQQHSINALLPGVTDISYLTGAWVAQQLGLAGFDTPEVSEIIFMKDAFRRWANKQGYPIPQAAYNLEDAKKLPLPLLVKPVDAYSGLGIIKINNLAELDAAVKTAREVSASGQIVIETFCEGQLYSHSAFIRDGNIACEFFVDEYCTVYPWQVNSSCISVTLSESMRKNVHDCMQTLVKELQLTDGLLHTQFIANETCFWLIELTRRSPGDLYSRLIELSTGIPYSHYFSQPFLGLKSAFELQRPTPCRAIVRHTVSLSQTQQFTSFDFSKLDGRVIETVPLKLPGESVNPAPHDRAGVIFAELDNFSALKTITPELKNYIQINER